MCALAVVCHYTYTVLWYTWYMCANCACEYCAQSRQDNTAKAHCVTGSEHSSQHWPTSLWAR